MTAQTKEAGGRRRRWPILQGLLPIERRRVPVEVLAGVTLAALAIPEVMGYASLAGMPVITGLYTILLPVIAFALLGSSRHLVVGADSATAALLAAGLAPLAGAGSSHYVALAGAVALLAAAFLLIARLIGLGFLADFLSRTVLVGFLTGVGIEVACGQVGGMLGLPEGKGVTIGQHNFNGTIGKLASTLQHISAISWTTAAVSASVIVLIVLGRRVTTKVPAALVAVVGLILVSWHWDLASHGVATLGPVPGGLPNLSLPGVGWGQLPSVVGTAASIFVLILAQSAATSRAYASKYDDDFDEDVDLVGLGTANVLAGVSGTFVVNGSPTKTQMVDGAGGHSQLAQVSMAVVVGVVLVFLTEPLQYMPEAVLASVVFVIGIELVDIAGMSHIWRLRRDEFVVAALTAAVVVFLGVEQGIVFAAIASIVDHLRRSYRPPTSVLQRRASGSAGRDWRALSAAPDHRSEPGLVIYRFAAPLYYANASLFRAEVLGFAESDEPLEWICLDLSATPDIDLTGLAVLDALHRELSARHVRLVMTEVLPEVQPELVRYGLVDLLGADAIFEGHTDVEAAFEHRHPT